MERLAIISDTHLPRGRRRLPPECLRRLQAADGIVHAGDFIRREVLDQLRDIAPVIAVHGNVDEPELQAELPAETVLILGGLRIGVVHNAGPGPGRMERLRRRFPGVQGVIFGHSHIPLHERGFDRLQIFNPGSPTDRRRMPNHTMGIADVVDGQLRFHLLPLD